VNVYAPSDVTNYSLYQEVECVFDQFPKCHMKISVGGFSAKVGRED